MGVMASPAAGDLFGNACDCDFNQDQVCSIHDFDLFLRDFQAQTDSGVGSDMNSDDVVSILDFGLFLSGFGAAKPGPSGLVP